MSSSSRRSNGVGGEEAEKLAVELSKTLKEGEKILAPTRRPDGTLRKPIRIRAGYVPQEEVAKYQAKGALVYTGMLRKPVRIKAEEVAKYQIKGTLTYIYAGRNSEEADLNSGRSRQIPIQAALWKKEVESLQEVPPGYSPSVVVDGKPKTKSAKRNERKKEKRLQAALDKDESLDKNEVGSDESRSVASMLSQMDDLSISANAAELAPTSNSDESLVTIYSALDIDKKIRALKKKIRLTESQLEKAAQHDMKPDKLEKITKLEGWREELKQLEHRKAEQS